MNDDNLEGSYPLSFYTNYKFDPTRMAAEIAKNLSSMTKEEYIPVGGWATHGFEQSDEPPIQLPKMDDYPPPPPIILVAEGGKEIYYNATVKGSIRFEEEVLPAPVYCTRVEWGDGVVTSFAFVRTKDKDLVKDAYWRMMSSSLPYDPDIFPPDARRWLDGAIRFFSDETRKRLIYHNVAQQIGSVLAGPAGCGKTIFSRHVSKVLGLPEFHYSPARIIRAARDNEELMDRAIYVFDDVEELLIEREEGESSDVLPWLLQQTDARDLSIKRLLLIVTNHPKNLDDALLRPGRFDARLDFAKPNKEQLEKCMSFYMRDDYNKEIADLVIGRIASLDSRTLAHISYLARLVYSGFVGGWEEALDYIEKFSFHKGLKRDYDESGIGFNSKMNRVPRKWPPRSED